MQVLNNLVAMHISHVTSAMMAFLEKGGFNGQAFLSISRDTSIPVQANILLSASQWLLYPILSCAQRPEAAVGTFGQCLVGSADSSQVHIHTCERLSIFHRHPGMMIKQTHVAFFKMRLLLPVVGTSFDLFGQSFRLDLQGCAHQD